MYLIELSPADKGDTIMVWNLDFNISAWFVCLVLIMYYTSRRNLPIRRNRVFFLLMLLALIFNTVDISASIIASYPAIFPHGLIYAINVFYYIELALLPYCFARFCCLLLRDKDPHPLTILIRSIPCIAAILVSMLTIVNGKVFYLDAEGVFHYGPWRILYFYETVFYLIICACYIAARGAHKLQMRHRIALYSYIVITIFGHVLQVFVMPYHQTVSLCSMISILIVFLTFQGPDYYRERRTGFFDSRGLELVLSERYHSQQSASTAGFIIENFRTIKYVYTEDVVAALLRQVASYLQTLTDRQYTFYLRNGVFVVLLGERGSALELRDQIINRFYEPFVYKNNEYILRPKFFFDPGYIPYHTYEEYRSTISLALRTLAPQSATPSMLITEDMYQQAMRALAVERALGKALNNDAIEIFYQPIYSTYAGRVTSAEALARIRDEELGLLMPDEFIPIAENNGSITRLGEQVFTKVCRFIQSRDMDALGLEYIEINLSPLQCRRFGTARRYIDIMHLYGVDPKYINLEITETGSTGRDFTLDNLQELTEQGICFSLDDYGTGYSNLINTIHLPFTIIKIDKSIVWAYFDGQSSILELLIHHFKTLGKKVVAEGVETKQMSEALIGMDCHYLQGFLYSKPIPESDFIDYLEQ